MLSRRQLLGGIGISLTGLVGGRVLADRSRSSMFDWPMARYDSAGTGYNPEASGPKDDVRVAWDRDLGSSFHGRASPIRLEDTLYVVGGPLAALDVETGAVQFTHGGAYRSSPARATPTAYRTDTVAVTSPDGIFGLNAGGGLGLGPFGHRFGVQRWHRPRREPSRDVPGPSGSPLPVGVEDTVYVAVPGRAQVVALRANDGRERWRASLEAGGGLRRPAVREGIVFATGYASLVAAFDAETGEERWKVDFADPAPLPPTATADGLVVPSRTAVRLLDAEDGRVRWTYQHEGDVTDGVVAVADGTVFVADAVGSLHAIDLETGEAVWTAPFGGEGTPVVADGVVYVSTRSAELAAFDAATGDRRWEYEATWRLSPPIVGDGRLYVVDRNRVLALEEGGET